MPKTSSTQQFPPHSLREQVQSAGRPFFCITPHPIGSDTHLRQLICQQPALHFGLSLQFRYKLKPLTHAVTFRVPREQEREWLFHGQKSTCPYYLMPRSQSNPIKDTGGTVLTFSLCWEPPSLPKLLPMNYDFSFGAW